jgi:hypothetical protein
MADIAGMDVSEMSEKDVGRLQSAMVKGHRGRYVENESLVNDLHRVAQINEREAEVMKEDAVALQSEEAILSGSGETEKGGIATQAQSMADKRVR